MSHNKYVLLKRRRNLHPTIQKYLKKKRVDSHRVISSLKLKFYWHTDFFMGENLSSLKICEILLFYYDAQNTIKILISLRTHVCVIIIRIAYARSLRARQ